MITNSTANSNKLKFNVTLSGFSCDDGKRIFTEIFGKDSLEKIDTNKKISGIENSGFVCTSTDLSVSFEASLKLIIEELEDKYSEELASKLFCGGLN